MNKPRIFLGSSGKQAMLLEALTTGLDDIADVVPWTTSFNPGTTTIERLIELTHEVDFAAFIFAQDDWTAAAPADPAASPTDAGQASPRDNVVFEAGLFGGVLGMPRTFILHASGAKLPTDLNGLTAIRYHDASDPDEVATITAKVRAAIENEWRATSIEGDWWQYALTSRSEGENSAVSLLRVTRDKSRALVVTGRSWRDDGSLSARYWSEASSERPAGIFYYFAGERPRDPNAPPIEGTGEITLESPNRASGYYTTRSNSNSDLNARTAGVYLRADAADAGILDGDDSAARVTLIRTRIADWQGIANS